MVLKKFAAIYSIIIGVAMIGLWVFFISINQVPEFNSEPIRISYHLIGEFLTAIVLLIGGFGLFKNRGWGFHVFLISMGMLLYTVIVSAGYYGQNGDVAFIGMFSILQVLTIFFIILGLCGGKDWKSS